MSDKSKVKVAKSSPPSACKAESSRASRRFARTTKTRGLGKSPSAIGSAESSPGSKLSSSALRGYGGRGGFTRRRLHVPTLRVMPKPRDTKVARKVTKELLARNDPWDASISLIPRSDKYFVYFRETFVSVDAA